MNVQLLIDAIVRQTTVLIAQLATSGGIRAPVAHLANQVFLDLARELDAQGVSRKVSADMFGMALRAYLRKIQRIGESSTEHGRSLWEAIYDFLGTSRGFVARAEVIRKFSRDDEVLVRGILHDLTENGLVLQTGSGADAVLRAATDEELGQMRRLKDGRIDELVWAFVYHHGPIAREELAKMEALRTADLDGALGRLLAEGRVSREDHPESPRLRAVRLVVPLGAELGWEAAVLDHYHAMVATICRKLLLGRRSAAEDDTGGSTYTYEVWPGHPLEGETRSVLSRFRSAQSDLRRRVRAHNDALSEIPAAAYQVVVYGGQHVLEDPEEDEG
jgi:hypothetical protein